MTYNQQPVIIISMKLHKLFDKLRMWYRYGNPPEAQQKLLGLRTDSIDIEFTAKRLASETSAEYVVQNLRTATNFASDYDLHEAAVEACDDKLLDAGGLVLEFGVASGRTINHFARLLPNATLHGFDSFEGLPETWNWNFKAGHFSRNDLPRVRNNVSLHKGWFDQTLYGFLESHKNPIALLHIDSDLYSSAAYILEALADRIVPGTVIVFDEYFNYPGWEQDEFRAWHEAAHRYGFQYEYLGFVSKHQQCMIRVTQV